MSTCTTARPLGALPNRLDPFGQILPTASARLRLRFAEAGGDGSGAGGDGEDGDGGDGSDALGDAGKKALDRMKGERNTARDALKAFTDLGVSPDQVKAWKDAQGKPDADKPAPAPDVDAITKKVREDLAKEFGAQNAVRLRGAEVRAQAAEMGFIKPTQALALVDQADLADVAVKDDGTVDAAAVKKLLADLAKDSPHLVTPEDTTASHRDAGIGASGGTGKPEVQPGRLRMQAAYAANTKKK
jgi:hypothetical protein